MGQRHYRKKWGTAVKLKILIGVLVFLIAVNLATIGSYVYFQMQDRNKLEGVPIPENFRGRFSTPPHLGLDRDQRQQLFEIRMSFEKDTREYSEKIRELRNDIFVAIKDDPISMGRIEEKLEEISKLRMQIEKIAIKKLIEARDYLSPMQRDHLYRFLLKEPPRFNGRAPFQRKQGFMRGKGTIENYNNNNHNKNKE